MVMDWWWRSQHCSHFTKEGSTRNMENMIHHLAWRSGEFLVVHVLLPALQWRYSGNGVKGTVMLIIGHCHSSKNAFLQMHHWGFMSYNKTYLNLCMQLFFLQFFKYFAICNQSIKLKIKAIFRVLKMLSSVFCRFPPSWASYKFVPTFFIGLGCTRTDFGHTL